MVSKCENVNRNNLSIHPTWEEIRGINDMMWGNSDLVCIITLEENNFFIVIDSNLQKRFYSSITDIKCLP